MKTEERNGAQIFNKPGIQGSGKGLLQERAAFQAGGNNPGGGSIYMSVKH
jgi:hypothetical protein